MSPCDNFSEAPDALFALAADIAEDTFGLAVPLAENANR
jgi:hypothetical protein